MSEVLAEFEAPRDIRGWRGILEADERVDAQALKIKSATTVEMGQKNRKMLTFDHAGKVYAEVFPISRRDWLVEVERVDEVGYAGEKTTVVFDRVVPVPGGSTLWVDLRPGTCRVGIGR